MLAMAKWSAGGNKELSKSLSNQIRLCMKIERTAGLSVGATPEFKLEFSLATRPQIELSLCMDLKCQEV